MPPLVELSNGHLYSSESEEEWFFACWCKELLDKGIILEAYRPELLELRSPLIFPYQLQMKTKIVDESFSLVKNSDYKGDMFIRWNPEYNGVFFINIGTVCITKPSPKGAYCKDNHLFYCVTPNESLVDVKGTFQSRNQHPFSRTQQLLAAFSIFVQKIIPMGKDGLFSKTFAPVEYLYTAVHKKKRTAFKSLDEFLMNSATIIVYEKIISN